MDSLWGNLSIEKITTPINILEEQGKYLKEKTGMLVYTEIKRNLIQEKVEENGKFVYDFLIKGRDMENYSYDLMNLTVPVELYPLDIKVDRTTYKEIENVVADKIYLAKRNVISAKNQKEFLEVLKIILSSERVNNLIIGIISLSNNEGGKEKRF